MISERYLRKIRISFIWLNVTYRRCIQTLRLRRLKWDLHQSKGWIYGASEKINITDDGPTPPAVWFCRLCIITCSRLIVWSTAEQQWKEENFCTLTWNFKNNGRVQLRNCTRVYVHAKLSSALLLLAYSLVKVPIYYKLKFKKNKNVAAIKLKQKLQVSFQRKKIHLKYTAVKHSHWLVYTNRSEFSSRAATRFDAI